MWYLYVIRTVDNCLYTGITTDVKRRFKEHISLGRKAAKYFYSNKPEILVFSHPVGNRSVAHKVEYHFKNLTKSEKEKIIRKNKLLFDVETGKIII
jgi:putative endonuclease